MGSLLNYEKCKQCGKLTYDNYNYHTGEINISCTVCGKTDKHCLERDKSGNVVIEDGNPKWVHTVHDGFGSMYIEDKEGCGSLFIFDNPITEDTTKDFFKTLENKGISKEKSRLFKWDKEKNEIVSIHGEIPEDFE
ncbi:MAG: hypothetical protein K0R54_779 [Clostridiaceae bacterium]|jgi:hypothetical protein|nr:hypothetical protein [Clostridiaceae bacterium]